MPPFTSASGLLATLDLLQVSHGLSALRERGAVMGRTVLCHGVLTYGKDNHWGFTVETPVMLKVVNGDWKIEPSAM